MEQVLTKFLSRKLQFIVFSVIFFCSCDNIPQSTVLKTYNADTVKLILNNGVLYRGDSVFTGRLYKRSPESDTLFVQDFDNGLKNGRSAFFYEDGTAAETRYFTKGKKEGMAEAWWPDGQKKFEYHYKNDLFEGLQQEWFENGQLYSSKNFINGYENGMQHNWDSSGAILSNYEARNGRNYGNIGQKHCKSIFENDSFLVRN